MVKEQLERRGLETHGCFAPWRDPAHRFCRRSVVAPRYGDYPLPHREGRPSRSHTWSPDDGGGLCGGERSWRRDRFRVSDGGLAELAGKVFSVERSSGLRIARWILDDSGSTTCSFRSAMLRSAGPKRPLLMRLVTAAADDPRALLEQVALGGRSVMPSAIQSPGARKACGARKISLDGPRGMLFVN